MNDNLDEMKGEYEAAKTEQASRNALIMARQVLITCINLMEFGNKHYSPMPLHLDGWAESVNENISMYDDVFAELHEKYKSEVTMGPELKLILMLVAGAISHHVTQLFCHRITKVANGGPGGGANGLEGLMSMMNMMNNQRNTATATETQTPKQQEMPPPSGVDDILRSVKHQR